MGHMLSGYGGLVSMLYSDCSFGTLQLSVLSYQSTYSVNSFSRTLARIKAECPVSEHFLGIISEVRLKVVIENLAQG